MTEFLNAERDSHASSSHEPFLEPTTKRREDLGKHSVFFSFPWRPKLRDLSEDQNYKGPMQKTQWRSRTSRWQFWWLDNSRSHNSQWRMWISEQSPIRSHGTRFSHSTNTVVSVQNKNFSGDEKEFPTLSWAVWKAKSHLHWQFMGTWQILWRFIMESSYFNTSSVWDEWYCWKAARRIKEVTFAVLLQSGLVKIGGRNPWNAIAIFEIFKTDCLMGKHLTNDDSENHSKDQ